MVDLMDPEDVRRKLPDAKLILRGLREEVAEWDHRVKIMEAFAGPSPIVPPPPRDHAREAALPKSIEEVVELVVEVVNADQRKIRSKSVENTLAEQGNPIDGRDVDRALELAAERGLIQPPTGRGWYAPLGYRTTDYEQAPDEFPAPENDSNPFVSPNGEVSSSAPIPAVQQLGGD